MGLYTHDPTHAASEWCAHPLGVCIHMVAGGGAEPLARPWSERTAWPGARAARIAQWCGACERRITWRGVGGAGVGGRGGREGTAAS